MRAAAFPSFSHDPEAETSTLTVRKFNGETPPAKTKIENSIVQLYNDCNDYIALLETRTVVTDIRA
jgi:hypothetical protein